MRRVVATGSCHRRVVVRAFSDEHLGVFTGLDALQSVAHGSAGLIVDDFRTSHVLTVLRVVGDGVVHVGDTAFVHEVNDQLQLVQALEVSHFRRVTRFGQHLEASLDQLNRATAQNCLLTEQVGFGLVLEGGFDDTGTTTAHTAGVGQSDVLGIAGSVLEDRDQIGNTAALDELGAYSVTRRLGGNHDHVQILARYDLVVVDGETVGESQGRALLQVRLDFVLVQLGLELVRSQDHDHVGSRYGSRYVGDFQTMGFSLGDGGRTRAQAHGNVNAGILQVAGVGMALGAVTDDSDLLALDDAQITVFVIKNVHVNPLSMRVPPDHRSE